MRRATPAIALLAALLAGGLSTPAAVAAEAAGPCGLAAVARAGEVSSFPPCFDVELTADASGRPPLSFTWTLPDSSTLLGNPVTLDTGALDDGLQEIVLEVSNADGSAELPVQVTIEPLAFADAPTLTPVANGLVTVMADTTGATEWRWTWGDGTATGWLSGCEGYAPSHEYPGAGVYQVTVEARSCRGGPVTWTGTLVVQLGDAIFSDGFESGDLTRWLVP